MTTRVLQILAAFDEQHHRLTLTEIAAAAGLPVSTAHRLLAELETSKIIRILGAGLIKGFNRIPIGGLHSLPLGGYQLEIKTPDGDSIYEIKVIKQ